MSIETAVDFWNTLDETERKEIIKIIVTQRKLKAHEFVTDKEFHELPHSQQLHLKEYYDNVILPQKGKQQVKYDGVIDEALPEEFACPICGSPAKQVTTKRGIHYKCKSCGFDSNRPFDFSSAKRQQYIWECASFIKRLFPKINIFENFPYSPEILFTGRKKDGPIKYDLGIYFNGMKLQRIRVEVNHNLSFERYFESEYCYVVGRPDVVQYLAKRDGLVAHYLVDEKEQKVGFSRMRQIVKICPMKLDNFGNQQYFIEKIYRPAMVTFNKDEMEDLLFLGFQKELYKDLLVL